MRIDQDEKIEHPLSDIILWLYLYRVLSFPGEKFFQGHFVDVS